MVQRDTSVKLSAAIAQGTSSFSFQSHVPLFFLSSLWQQSLSPKSYKQPSKQFRLFYRITPNSSNLYLLLDSKVISTFLGICYRDPLLLHLFCTCVQACSVVSDFFVTPWTAICQASLSMAFPRQEY